MEIVLTVSSKSKGTFTLWLAIPIPGIYPREIKTYIYKKTGTRTFITKYISNIYHSVIIQATQLKSGQKILRKNHMKRYSK